MALRPVIAITGFGQCSALGKNAFRALGALDAMPPAPPSRNFFGRDAEKPVFSAWFGKESRPDLRLFEFLGRAAGEALEQAKLFAGQLLDYRVGVCIGTTVGCQFCAIDNNGVPTTDYLALREGIPADNLAEGCHFLASYPAEWLARWLCVEGPCATIANACSSGADAIGVGAEWIRNDLCDIAICGGCDSLGLIPYKGFQSLGVYSDTQCKPFAESRDGLNLGEGAGVLVLENNEHRLARHHVAKYYLLGYGSASDSWHLTAPEPSGDGLRRAVEEACEDAGIVASELAEINPHGTATLDNDAVESKVFSSLCPSVPVVPTKQLSGHTLGAAGGIEAVLSLLRCPLDGMVLSTSLAFGGCNTALLFARKPAEVREVSESSAISERQIFPENERIGRASRRADSFCRKVVRGMIAAAKSLPASIPKERIGIVLATSFGPHNSVFKFVDELLDYPDMPASALLFSHTVHNAAVAYASIETGAKGPCATLCRSDNAWSEAKRLAKCWLDSGRADAVLAGEVDEEGFPMKCFIPGLAERAHFSVFTKECK